MDGLWKVAWGTEAVVGVYDLKVWVLLLKSTGCLRRNTVLAAEPAEPPAAGLGLRAQVVDPVGSSHAFGQVLPEKAGGPLDPSTIAIAKVEAFEELMQAGIARGNIQYVDIDVADGYLSLFLDRSSDESE